MGGQAAGMGAPPRVAWGSTGAAAGRPARLRHRGGRRAGGAPRRLCGPGPRHADGRRSRRLRRSDRRDIAAHRARPRWTVRDRMAGQLPPVPRHRDRHRGSCAGGERHAAAHRRRPRTPCDRGDGSEQGCVGGVHGDGAAPPSAEVLGRHGRCHPDGVRIGVVSLLAAQAGRVPGGGPCGGGS